MTGNIIKFPNISKRKQLLADVLIDRLTDTSNHVDLGHVPFTCATCGEISSFDFSGLIFKCITFYCAKCGHGYKVTNPMFTNHQNINSK